jgi:hypothetical protein
MNENTNERIKDIAEKAGFICNLILMMDGIR